MEKYLQMIAFHISLSLCGGQSADTTACVMRCGSTLSIGNSILPYFNLIGHTPPVHYTRVHIIPNIFLYLHKTHH